MSYRILLVCLGNICRSPTAEAVLRARLMVHGLAGRVQVDSCGTGDWHVGKPPDARATAAAARRGYDMSALRARQLRVSDFSNFDLVLAMDDQNLADIRRLAGRNVTEIGKFLDFHPAARGADVPDPYYGGDEGFDRVLDLIEQGSDGLIRERLGEVS